MEEVATCISCESQEWTIYIDRVECAKCEKKYTWPIDCTDAEATKAQDILNLVNDNY